MDVVVTGSHGLIGSALVRSLEADGHRVLRLVRSAPSGSDEARWDPRSGTIDAASLEGVDAVVHLAGAGIGDQRWTPERKRVILESRTLGTSLLARTLAELNRPPAVLASGSAIGFYGDRRDEILTEQSTPGEGFLTEVVQAWEAATAPAEEAGIRVAHLRTGIVLSAEGGALAKMLPLFRFGLGGPFGAGREWWSWISLPDEVAAIRHVLDHDIAGPVNLTAPSPVTNRELAKTLGHVMHRPAVVPVPSFGPKLLLGSELAEALLFTSAHVESTVLGASGFEFSYPDAESALRAVLDRPG
jgi:uncharacterized protein (TIGR01777 family)